MESFVKKSLKKLLLLSVITIPLYSMDKHKDIPAKRKLNFQYMPPAKRTKITDPTEMLFDAIEKNDLRIARNALLSGADVKAEYPEGAETPLLRALNHKNPNEELIKLLLEYKSDPNQFDHWRLTTALHKAVTKYSYSIVQLLLDYQANPNISNYDNETPTDWADDLRDPTIHPDVLYALLVRGGEPKSLQTDKRSPQRYGLTPNMPYQSHIVRNWNKNKHQFCVDALNVFIKHKDYKAINILLNTYDKCILSYRDDQGNSALHHAALNNNFKCAALLLTYFPALVLVTNDSGLTAEEASADKILIKNLLIWARQKDPKFTTIAFEIMGALENPSIGYLAEFLEQTKITKN